MIKVNIVGDFYVDKLTQHHFGNKLVEILKNADLNVVNMEGPIQIDNRAPIHKSGPILSQDITVPRFLESNGFNMVSLANNHIMDFGEDALNATINSFSSAETFGAGTFTESYKIKVCTVKGKRIGFLGITQYEFGVLEDEAYSKIKSGTAWLNHPLINELIKNAHQYCDFLIVIPHAGCEHFDYPLPEIRTLYRHFVSMGADAVIGGHPHVPQCWETYHNKPIVYSLGNFCFDKYNNNPLWYKSIMACLTINSNDTISLTIEPMAYDYPNKCVDILYDESLMTHLSNTNNNFQDEERYISKVNERCLQMEQHYLILFENSGFFRPTFKKNLRLLLEMAKNYITKQKRFYDDTHFINNLRCETHRWIISRIYELKSRQEQL